MNKRQSDLKKLKEYLEIKNTTFEIRISMEEFNNRLDTVEKRKN